ncbi:MAG: aquaporin, partial [Labilithrix sp.]|nr:aquaporin [Labilithrix sp.]
MSLTKRAVAELIGTFWLVLGGCGAAVLAARFGDGGIGVLGVALAFGLTVVTGMYALGAISGGHFNPAITVGLATAKRFAVKDVIPYVVAQVLGAILGAAVLYMIARGAVGFDASASGFAANGYGEHSPNGYSLMSGLTSEIVMTLMFVMIVLGVTDTRTPSVKGFAPLAIGLALTLIHLVSIPVTNTSVNPARSTGPALFAGGWALSQLWLFWVAPLVGGVLGGLLYPAVAGEAAERP